MARYFKQSMWALVMIFVQPFENVINNQKIPSPQKGFTLIEISLALLLIGILMASVLTLSSSMETTDKSKQAQQQVLQIKQALLTYLKVNKHLPCPDTSGDGKQNIRLSSGITTCKKRQGFLPTLDIGVKDKDAWGNAFYYRVNPRSENKKYINDYCQAASVFGQSGAGSVPNKGGLCTDSQVYYCQCAAAKSDGACPGLCDFNADPRTLGTTPGNTPPYFMLDSPAVGVDNASALKNMTVIEENGNIVETGIVAMVVSFGQNGQQTWDHCQANTQANSAERNNCDNDQAGEFELDLSAPLDDYLTWITMNDVKQAMIAIKGIDYD